MNEDVPVRPSDEEGVRAPSAELRRMWGIEEEEDERMFGWRGSMNEEAERA